MLRQLRVSRELTRDVVGARAECGPSLVSMVESGARVLQPWLARRLDRVYGTGGMVTGVAASLAYRRSLGCATLDEDEDDGVVLVELPLRGVTVMIPRRAVWRP
jgi:hypothetical protein